ncbi:unnamed protein product [Spodoptera exigua]|nr:unnamed protein product [Spodoptera exigua]
MKVPMATCADMIKFTRHVNTSEQLEVRSSDKKCTASLVILNSSIQYLCQSGVFLELRRCDTRSSVHSGSVLGCYPWTPPLHMYRAQVRGYVPTHTYLHYLPSYQDLCQAALALPPVENITKHYAHRRTRINPSAPHYSPLAGRGRARLQDAPGSAYGGRCTMSRPECCPCNTVHSALYESRPSACAAQLSGSGSAAYNVSAGGAAIKGQH